MPIKSCFRASRRRSSGSTMATRSTLLIRGCPAKISWQTGSESGWLRSPRSGPNIVPACLDFRAGKGPLFIKELSPRPSKVFPVGENFGRYHLIKYGLLISGPRSPRARKLWGRRETRGNRTADFAGCTVWQEWTDPGAPAPVPTR